MSATTRVQSVTKYDHTPQILGRRRALFPSSETEEDSDLGHISPLNFNSDQECETNLKKNTDSIGDYHIIGIVENTLENHVENTPNNKATIYASSETMSPLYLSPFNRVLPSGFGSHKLTPSHNLKTPHDTSNTQSKAPKLVRKSLLLDSDISDENVGAIKRKASPPGSPPSKAPKLDSSKNSKVRTALFPEVDIAVPTKSFYSSSSNNNNNKTIASFGRLISSEKDVVRLGNNSGGKKYNSRRRYGQINAGVRHKIRKPKQKKISRPLLLKAALNILDNSPLNEYLKDLEMLKKQPQEMIENKENIEVNVEKRKRQHSPPPDNSKKFFKFSRHKAVVTVSQNIKLQVDNGKMSLIEKGVKKRRLAAKIDLDASDLLSQEANEEPLLTSSIDAILTNLGSDDENIEPPRANTIVLEAHNSVAASDTSILLHGAPNRRTHEIKLQADALLSPTSQMCNMTSGLALNSPKKAKNLTSVLNNMPAFNSVLPAASQGKLFPIFCGGGTPASPVPKKSDVVKTSGRKKFRNLSENQMLLDAGQKRWGVTQCTECSFVYHMGDPGDEIAHLNYHGSANVLRFIGWKNERVISNLPDGRIIQILPNDSRYWWKKVKDLLEVVNRELGYYEMELKLDHAQIFLYIKNKTIVGCVVAAPETVAHRMLASQPHESDLCSEESYPIKCGVSRIWVSPNHRKQGIATAMMNSLKKNFMFDCGLKNCDIAFSSPTEMGKKFAANYFQTPNFLIYL